MDTNLDDLPIEQRETAGQFEIRLDGHTALLAYELPGDGTIVFPRTAVPKELEGKGIAARLARHALEDAKARGLKVVPKCAYVRAYLARHDEYAGLVQQEVEAQPVP